MTTWDLSRIRYTVRKLTGQFDEQQLPSASPAAGAVTVTNPPGIDDYINDFYLFDFPEHLRTLKLKTFYTIQTIPNVGTYPVPQNYYQLEPPLYSDGYQYNWYQSPDAFYRVWPEFNFIDHAIATGNGGQSYSFTLTQAPVQQGTVTIGINPQQTGQVQQETFIDTDVQGAWVNPGVLTGSLGGTGTINYLTGAVTLTYFNNIPAGFNINAHYHPYVAARARDVMFYNQQLFVRPIPDDVYSVKMIAYIQPVVAIANSATTRTQFDGTLTDMLMWNEWWQVVAYGTAIKILIENGDYEQAATLKQFFEEQKLLAQRRCLKQLGTQRIPTVYTNSSSFGFQGNSWPIY